ncbi:MAG: hypothetical protein FWE37_00265 [Spirochaetaceae bacterium]|nr:hypothetical protein [Spirochaetaceae bacterium]
MPNQLNYAVKIIMQNYPTFPAGKENDGYFLTSHIFLDRALRGDWKSLKHIIDYLLKDEETAKKFDKALKIAMNTHLRPVEEQDGYLALAYTLLEEAYNNRHGKALRFLFDYLAKEEADDEGDNDEDEMKLPPVKVNNKAKPAPSSAKTKPEDKNHHQDRPESKDKQPAEPVAVDLAGDIRQMVSEMPDDLREYLTETLVTKT